MSQNFRQKDILQTLQKDGKVTVDELALRFGVTLQTIRRDLSKLAEANKAERVHGGALLPSGTTNIEYEARRTLNDHAKRHIAQSCARHIPNGCSIFLNLGTTTEAVARHLLDHRDLLVITNNINVAHILAQNQNCEIMLTGGRMRPADGGLVGQPAIQSIRQFRFDFAVIGCSALDEDGDFFDFDIEEVAVSQTILAQSRNGFLVADRSKFDRHAPVRIGSLASLSAVFTNGAVNEGLNAKCSEWNTAVHCCR